MNPQERDYTFDEEARRTLAQVYTLLLDLAREDASREDTSADDPDAPESMGKAHNA